MRYLLLTVLIVSGTAGANTYGDFAPLKTGNCWIYDSYTLHSNLLTKEVTRGTQTITVTHSATINDTVWYYLRNHRKNTKDSLYNEIVIKSTSFDTTTYDTLIESSNTIRSNNFLSGAFPVRYEHEISPDKQTYNDLQQVDGVWEFSDRSNGGASFLITPQSRSTIYWFRSGIGVVSCSSYVAVHMQTVSNYTTLRSFNGTSLNTAPYFTLKKSGRLIAATRSTGRIMLPNITVTNKGTVYTLQGRVQTEFRKKAQKHSRKWNDQLYDLFR